MKYNIKNTFKEKLYECDKHIEKITVSKKYLSNLMPLSVDSYLSMDDIQISFVDQLIYRFSKLQDTMGEKIFPSILILSQENVKNKTFIDILNRLEELEVLDKNKWLRLREVRNEIAHEYSFNTDEVVDSIESIFYKSDELIEIYNNTLSFCKDKFDFLVSKETLGEVAMKEALELDGEFITLEDIKRENNTHE